MAFQCYDEIMVAHTSLTEKFEALRPVLNELARRRWAATEARAFGRGGISAVARATGLSRKTIRAGIREMQQDASAAYNPETARMRRPGAGRKRRATRIQRCSGTWRPWWSRQPAAIPSRPCAGLARVCGASPPSCRPRGTKSVRSWSVSCSTRPVTACRAHARRAKAPTSGSPRPV